MMKRIKKNLVREQEYLMHDLHGIWVLMSDGEIRLSQLVVSLFFSVILLPAWILGFILATIGWYDNM